MSSRLMKLLAELRVIIYKYVFSFDHSEDEEIETKNVRGPGPQHDILGTCQEIHNEAKPTYDDARKLFLGQKCRYRATVNCDERLKWLISEEMVEMCAGPQKLPCARSLAVTFQVSSKRGPRSFTIRFEVGNKGSVEARLGNRINCNDGTGSSYRERLLIRLISTRLSSKWRRIHSHAY